IPIDGKKLFGFCLLSSISVVLGVIPFGAKLEIGDDYVKSYLFGFCLRNLRAQNIERVVYTNLFLGGLGQGKGLKGWEKLSSGRKKYFSLGDQIYGKEAIAHAKRVLEAQLVKEEKAVQ